MDLSIVSAREVMMRESITENSPITPIFSLTHRATFSHLRNELNVNKDERIFQFFKQVVENRIREGDD